MIETSGHLAAAEELTGLLENNSDGAVLMFLNLLPPEDTSYAIASLNESDRHALFSLLARANPELAGDLLGHFDDAWASDLIEDLDPHDAARIVEELPTDEQADLLGEMKELDQEAILQAMDPGEAADVREALEYDRETAGGLMTDEYLVVPDTMLVREVLEEIQDWVTHHGEDAELWDIYTYDEQGRLNGSVPLRVLPMLSPLQPLLKWLEETVVVLRTDLSLDAVEDTFDRVDEMSLPVVDFRGRMAGLLRRSAVQEALSEQASANLMKFGGIIGGEEFRDMPLFTRTIRRAAFLLPNIFLSLASVAVLSLFENVIKEFTIVAAFAPLVANLSGASGNQAVAVSIREMALDLIHPRDHMRVLGKEIILGAINGLLLGAVVMLLVISTRGLDRLDVGILVGLVYAFSSMLAVCVGGVLPLLLRAIRVDPAMVASPVLTAITDACSYFLTFSLTLLYLSKGVGS